MRRAVVRGFTLIEILMVVIIIGIASAIIVPQITSRDDLKVTAAARALMSDIIYAQNRAISTQSKIYITFDTASQKYTVLSGTWPGTTVNHPVNLTPFVVQYGSGNMKNIQLDSANFGGTNTTVGFDALGSPLTYTSGGTASTMTSGSIVVKCGGYPLTVSIQPYTGELTVN